MTPFQKELQELIKECKKESTAFTSPEEDAANAMYRITKFSTSWDFKRKYEECSKKLKSIEQTNRKDRDNAELAAGRQLLKELIPIIDEAFILIKRIKEGVASPVYRHIKLLLLNFEDVLARRKGSIIIPEVNDELDPELHKAVKVEEDPKHTGNTIVEVYRYGYSIYNQVIREAEVKVKCGTRK